MFNRVSLMLALRYLRPAQPRSARQFLIPLVMLVIVGAFYGIDFIGRHVDNPKILGLHAEWARAIGNAKWVGWTLVILVTMFIVTLRNLTIFTTFSTYGIFVGSAALVIVLSVMSGFEADIKHKILGTHAHVVVTKNGDDPFTEFPQRLEQIRATPGVVGATPVLSSEAMIASPANRSNVVVKGIDAATIGSVTDLRHDISLGELDWLAHPEKIQDEADNELRVDAEHDDDEPSEKPNEKLHDKLPKVVRTKKSPPGIIVGRELANSLRIYLGDDVSLVSPTGGIGPSGVTAKAKPYRVAAIFFSGMFEYDAKFVYVDLNAAQKLFDQPDEASEIDVKIPDPDVTGPVTDALRARLGPGYEVDDWQQLNSGLFSALSLEKVVMFVFLSFIILVAAFSIIANGQMIATQKMAEIAMLKSMGATDGTIAGAFVILGAVLGQLGVLAGVIGGVFGAFALRHWGYALDPDVFYLTQLPVVVNPHEIYAVCIAGVVVTVFATLQPAWRATRMTPVEGLREGGH